MTQLYVNQFGIIGWHIGCILLSFFRWSCRRWDQGPSQIGLWRNEWSEKLTVMLKRIAFRVENMQLLDLKSYTAEKMIYS